MLLIGALSSSASLNEDLVVIRPFCGYHEGLNIRYFYDSMKLEILVAAHRPYVLPASDIYKPIEVGACSRKDIGLGGYRDNTGLNISEKNPNYCELTAVYWAWKNLPSDVTHIGLVHYRRYFGKRRLFQRPVDCVLPLADFQKLLSSSNVLLPPKRNYFIETVRSQYVHAHHAKDLEVLEQVLRERFPNYLEAFDTVMNGRRTHIFNMFVMRRDFFNHYCEFLFSVLSEVERRLDISSYSKNDARVFGFLSERLLDVWLMTNQISYSETSLVFTEPTNWIKKGAGFLLRKFGFR